MKKALYIGLDIGGSKIRGVLWDGKGKRVAMAAEIATPATKRAFISHHASLIARLFRKRPGRIRGVGIGVAGLINGTRVIHSPNISYLQRFDLKQALPMPVPLRVDNDARAFARAEAKLGRGRRSRRMLAFTIGTGIGRAYVEKGRVRTIRRFEHAEEWERRYQHIRDQRDDAALAAFLGEKLAPIIQRHRPDVVILGGGVLGRRGFTSQLTTNLRASGVKANIIRGRLGPNAAAIGAALLFGG